MNALDILTSDHRQVDAMIAELEKAGESGAGSAAYKSTFEQMVDALNLHMRAEEEILYPAMRQFEEEKEMVIEAYDEHNTVKGLLTQMNELDPASPEFQSNLKQVKTGIQHHVSEEEGEMFPEAREKLGETRLEEIGRQIMEMKNQGDPSRAAFAKL